MPTDAEWATHEARRHVHYLHRCENEAEEIDYMTCALLAAEARGALRGSTETASSVLKKLTPAANSE